MTLKTKLVLMGLIGAVVISLVGLAGTIMYFNNSKAAQIEKSVAAAHHNFEVAMAAKKKVWQTNALQIAANNDVIQAVKNNDREKADSILKNLGKVFKENTGFKNVNIHLIDKDLKSFYKSWAPDKFGEKVDYSKGYALVKKSGKSFAAMEIAPKGVRLKGLFPIVSEGQFLGVANFEGGLNSIKRTLKPYDIDFLYFMSDKYLKIAPGMEKKPRLGSYLLNQKDIDKVFFEYAGQNSVLSKLDGTDYFIDDQYLVMKGAFKSFDESGTGLYLLGIKTDVVMETINTLKRMIFTIFGFLTGLFCLLIVGLVVYISINVIKPIVNVSNSMFEGADQVASASNQISTTGQSIADGASQQAAAIEETSASMEEISSMTKSNEENASQADILMTQANQVVEAANNSMGNLTGSMEDISKASEETSKIIKTIDEIAFQTNLLALNAAVEAARAGEAGAGFAVVADEVRNLAMRAAEAAKDTATLIEGTVKKVHLGAELVSNTNDEFTKVADSSSKVGKLVSEIAAASKEQSRGVTQVNQAIIEMDKIIQNNAASAEESASASEELNAQAQQLKDFVTGLVVLVSGQGDQEILRTKTANVRKDPSRKNIASKSQSERPEKKQIARVAESSEVKPNQVIPFDDDDFENF